MVARGRDLILSLGTSFLSACIPVLLLLRLVRDRTDSRLSYLKLSNPSDDAVDLSGYTLRGAVQFTLAAGEVMHICTHFCINLFGICRFK